MDISMDISMDIHIHGKPVFWSNYVEESAKIARKSENAVNADIILKSIDENELNYIQRFLT